MFSPGPASPQAVGDGQEARIFAGVARFCDGGRGLRSGYALLPSPAPVAWRFSPPEGRRCPGASDGRCRSAAGGRLGLLRTMRRRPRLLGRNSRRRTPRAMQGASRMRSIVHVWAWVHPVLIGRDEERRPPVQLRPVPPPGGSLPALRLWSPVLFAALQRPGAASVGAPGGAVRRASCDKPDVRNFGSQRMGLLRSQSRACRAPAALPRTPPCPAAGSFGQHAESDASPFDRRAGVLMWRVCRRGGPEPGPSDPTAPPGCSAASAAGGSALARSTPQAYRWPRLGRPGTDQRFRPSPPRPNGQIGGLTVCRMLLRRSVGNSA